MPLSLFKGISMLCVSPKGFEPPSLVPETKILSIELRRQFGEDRNSIAESHTNNLN
jgi:hypothetical protein